MANLYLDSIDARIKQLEEDLNTLSDTGWLECNSTIEGLKEAKKMYIALRKLNARFGNSDPFEFTAPAGGG